MPTKFYVQSVKSVKRPGGRIIRRILSEMIVNLDSFSNCFENSF